MAVKVVIRVQRSVEPGREPRPDVLDYAVEVHDVPENEVVSILMAAAARILASPVAVTIKAEDAERFRAAWSLHERAVPARDA